MRDYAQKNPEARRSLQRKPPDNIYIIKYLICLHSTYTR